MNDLIPIVGILAGCGSIVFIIRTVMGYAQRRQQARVAAEFHAKLLDRLGSTKDFSEFLNSDGGTRFLDSLALQRDDTPQQRMLRSMSTGIVLTVLGLGLAMYTSEIPPAQDLELGVGFLAAVSLSLGIGLLLATWGTLKMSQRLGLLNPPTVPPLTTHSH